MAEESFFRGGEIGISYILFTILFYGVFYWRYRHFHFTHQRLGWLILICIWLLALSYFTHNTAFFNVLNILVIPVLVMFHLVLITSPHQMEWKGTAFLAYVFTKLIEMIKFNVSFASSIQKSGKEIDQSQLVILKKVLTGLVLSIPVLAVVLTLLMSADAKFKQLLGGFPDWFQVINTETIVRGMIILITTAVFFGFLQVLHHKHIKIIDPGKARLAPPIDAVIAFTILVVMDLVYLLFTFVQFKYFFGGTLQENYTFAQYARKGFFELLFVSVINLSLLTVVLTFVKRSSGVLNRLKQIMLSLLVIFSAVILSSAFLRLGMYEDAYGFTFTRILAHSFMIFLGIIFAYSFVQIWIEKLSFAHFFFITSFVYYSALNTVDLNQLVVTKNINRFEQSGKVDIHYLNTLSYTGIHGLISLYKKDPNIPELGTILMQRKEETRMEKDSWQSFNLRKQQVKNELEKLHIE
jgi:hypothetical protein